MYYKICHIFLVSALCFVYFNCSGNNPLAPNTKTRIGVGNNPSWSPDGTQLVVSNWLLFTMSTNGNSQTKITSPPSPSDGDWFDNEPDWSPDGEKIVFSGKGRRYSDLGDSWDLWIVSATGDNMTQLTSDRYINEDYPTWSPDGSKIAYVGDGKVFVISSSGGVPQVIPGISSWGQLAWSDDGTSLAVCNNGIQIVTLDGTILKTLVPDIRPGGCTWSPNGKTIAFTDYATGIWTVPASGGTPKLVIENITNTQNFEAPDWSPDGKYLAVEKRVSSEIQEIWIFPM